MRDDRHDEAEATLLQAREDAERFGLTHAWAQAQTGAGRPPRANRRVREAIDLYEGCMDGDLTPTGGG